LRLDDGRIVEVVAAPEPLTEIRASDSAALIRLAWHLGNRHLPTELLAKSLRIRRDGVIEAMIRGLGGRTIPLEAPFNPEGGAYVHAPTPAGGPDHHDHAHDDHDHDCHGHDRHAHDHDDRTHGHEGHDHGPEDHASHKHDHGHGGHRS
jgi:urease accessory protein